MSLNVLITGASRGIGKAIAARFAKEGANLYLTCLNSYESLCNFSIELSEKYNIMCTPYKCDVGNYEEVATLFSTIGHVDIVINNAGIAWLGLFTDMSIDDWNKIIQTNLTSVYNTSHFAVPLMLRQGSGKIINISSVWGNVGASTEVAYSASKGGVNAFTKALAKELAISNISVNAIACGVIDTDMNRKHLSNEELECLKEEIPADRIATPDEVADMVFTIANAPGYLTGQIISFDGGWI
ncbi:elongation factor P 5-aminopentanone reductase [Butyrivibrio sp. NC3005]|uniref:elongation factor P 5-aminopentanone reductase n=1 Tax=Butyrivibrio sp. NC3005 TaxID=1280685 RepID=UPI00040F1459|nr:SDR family NAD(P)-dependent oxidoreductase [Butyrivibrio sp. NC3005]